MSQTWDPHLYARHGRFVADLATGALNLLAPTAGERILDLGCGDGALTEVLAHGGAVVVGVDASSAQVDAARARGLDARVADATALPFDAEFDAVFSNAVLHWIPATAADRVLDGVRRALRPGGRFVAEMGGAGNLRAIGAALDAALRVRGGDPAALRQKYYPEPAEYQARLERHGFDVEVLEHFARPTPLPGDIADWFATFAGDHAAAVAAEDRAGLFADARAALASQLCDPSGRWIADYVRLRFRAVIARRPSSVDPTGSARRAP